MIRAVIRHDVEDLIIIGKDPKDGSIWVSSEEENQDTLVGKIHGAIAWLTAPDFVPVHSDEDEDLGP
jgi:hypothetical protein